MLSKQEKQDIVEAVVMGIVTQGGPSTDGDGMCAYRGLEGRRCSIGLFISEENYQEWDETHPVEDISVQNALVDSLFPHEDRGLEVQDIAFFGSLQLAHDMSHMNSNIPFHEDPEKFWSLWVKEMKELCSSVGLRFPEELV